MENASQVEYKNWYAKQARQMALIGLTEDQMSFVLGVDLNTFAVWAWYRKDFYDAITPSDEDREAFESKKSLAASKRKERRAKYMANNPSQRLRASFSARVWAVLKGKKDQSLFDLLPYTLDDLKSHIESKFVAGMTWDNYGKWHVDHIRPCASFDMTDPQQFDECWSLANLQPLWALDNIRKGAKYASA